jgi:hypothetical protein
MASAHSKKAIESSMNKVFDAEIALDHETNISCHDEIIFLQLILPHVPDETRQQRSRWIIQDVSLVTTVFRKGAGQD